MGWMAMLLFTAKNISIVCLMTDFNWGTKYSFILICILLNSIIMGCRRVEFYVTLAPKKTGCTVELKKKKLFKSMMLNQALELILSLLWRTITRGQQSSN